MVAYVVGLVLVFIASAYGYHHLLLFGDADETMVVAVACAAYSVLYYVFVHFGFSALGWAE